MFNKKLKLKNEDLIELQEKDKLVRQHIAISQALEAQKNVWLVSLFSKYGLDGNKEWSFNLVTGVITEVKQPTKGGEK
ncbi:MAG: hypothetical protein PHQ59_01795 [Candidatus Daviesbacteria bacterium]|nr:hypothetical protein [Candidatus Daviesbacteria bacterium]